MIQWFKIRKHFVGEWEETCLQTLSTVGLLGLGGVGAVYAKHLHETLGPRFYALLDRGRQGRYRQSGVFVNDERVDFAYLDPADCSAPLDLVLVAVKGTQLTSALQTLAPCIGPGTVLLCLQNGVSSEAIARAMYPQAHVPYAFVVGIDTLRTGTRVDVKGQGRIVCGDDVNDPPTALLCRVQQLLCSAGIACEIPRDMRHAQWWKFMMNCALNQLCAIRRVPYGGFIHDVHIRALAQKVCEEVAAVGSFEGVSLTQDDMACMFNTIATFSADGQPSMLQDVLAQRETEVELFAGTVMRLAQRHDMDAPYATALYHLLCSIQQAYAADVSHCV